jgi:hypothetical protein
MAALTLTILCLLFPVFGLGFASLWGLIQNYGAARKIGLPVMVVPVSPENPLWMMLSRRVMPWVKRIPFGSGSFSRFGALGWEFYQRNSVVEFGDGVVICTPGKNWVYVWNPDTVSDILQRRNEFFRPVELFGSYEKRAPT